MSIGGAVKLTVFLIRSNALKVVVKCLTNAELDIAVAHACLLNSGFIGSWQRIGSLVTRLQDSRCGAIGSISAAARAPHKGHSHVNGRGSGDDSVRVRLE